MALLAKHGAEPGVIEKLKAGLTDSKANTRGAAARAINVAGLKDLLPAVQVALEKEGEPLVAREQIRTLAWGGVSYDDAILAATGRFESRLDRDVAHILARALGPSAIPLYFSALSQWPLSNADRVAFFRMASRGKGDPLVASLSMALGRGDAVAWHAATYAASPFPSEIEGIQKAALGSTNEAIRGEAAWFLARTYRQRPADADAILETVSRTDATKPEWQFGVEMLSRVLGKSPTEEPSWVDWLRTGPKNSLEADFGDTRLLDFLTASEREALSRPDFKLKPESRVEARKESALALVRGLPAGVASDLFDLESCHSNAAMRWFALAVVDFRPDGVPKGVRVTTEPTGDTCHRTAEALFEMSLAPYSEADPSSNPASYLALFDPGELSCPDTLMQPMRVGGDVTAPKLVKKVEPVYPGSARRNNEEGVSIYEAVISETGCIRDLRLLKSSTPVLDVMGLEAVSQWIYSPATRGGQPVPVFLTVTVTFSLHGEKKKKKKS
jgi:TonB family protein